jgi:hypothetical protein
LAGFQVVTIDAYHRRDAGRQREGQRNKKDDHFHQMGSPASSEGIEVICAFSQNNIEAKIIATSSATNINNVLSRHMAGATRVGS